jgi:hypothetical protein
MSANPQSLLWPADLYAFVVASLLFVLPRAVVHVKGALQVRGQPAHVELSCPLGGSAS